MSSVARQIETILANPTIYNTASYNKPGYLANSKVTCDQCLLENLVIYVSNPATPNVDLCTTCFNQGKPPVVGLPYNIVHAAHEPWTRPPGGMQQHFGMKGARAQMHNDRAADIRDRDAQDGSNGSNECK